jgi:hypothetical protein
VPNFWLKCFTALHEDLVRELNAIMVEPKNSPTWLTSGTTYLLPKKAEGTNNPKNYRPITCLPTTYKLLTSILSEHVDRHLTGNNIMAEEQKGCTRGSYGCKEQLLVNQMILDDARSRKKNLSVAWIDYQKAFDSIPHSWILECLKLYRVSPRVVHFLTHIMPTWRTTMTLQGARDKVVTREINIRCGIFQGDSLSPLLFCLAINPLSELLNSSGVGYHVGKGKTENHFVNHLLYMDDLKLFASGDRQLEGLLNTVDMFSTDIRMRFGLDKCAKLSLRRGKPVETGPIVTTNQEKFDELHAQSTYKYLGFEENATTVHHGMKVKLSTEFKKRVRTVLKTELNGKNKITAINAFAIPVLSYSFGIINWTIAELQNLDRKTRKLLTLHRQHHPKAAIERLYLPRRDGGRGLLNIEGLHQRSMVSLQSFVDEKKGRLRTMLGETRRFVKASSPTDPEDVKKTQRATFLQRWHDKPLHGQHAKVVEKPCVDKNFSYQWLSRAGLKGETEGTIFAVQDQTIRTRYYERHVMGKEVNDTCRACQQHPETIHHIVSGCPALAANTYIERHDNVGRYVHWCLCKDSGMPATERWYQHQPTAVQENEKVKLLWNLSIQTDRTIRANKPDIVAVDKPTKTTKLIEISVPADSNLQQKTREKMEKYTDLRIEVERMWGTKTSIVPVIVGATGVVLKDFQYHLKKLNAPSLNPTIIQKSAILGTAHLLRRILERQ